MHGATKWLMLLTTELQKLGHKSVIYTVRCHIPIPFWFQGEIVTLSQRALPSSRETRGLWKLLGMSLDVVAMAVLPFWLPRNTELVVLHSERSLFAALLCRVLRRRAKLVYYCYQPPRELYDLNDYARKDYGRLLIALSPLLRVYKWLDRKLVRIPHRVLVWSDEYQDFARSVYGELPLENVPAGVDFEQYSDDAVDPELLQRIREDHHTAQKTVLLTVSVLAKKKNLSEFVRLVAGLRQGKHRVHGLIIGEGPEEEVLRAQIAEIGVEDCVELLGFVSQEELPHYYHISDIVLYLERDGAWTMSTIEAGAARKPVIVAGGGSMPSLVRDGRNGFIVEDIFDAKALLERTATLVRDAAVRSQMGKANYHHCLQFSSSCSAERLIDIVHQI